MINNDLDKHTQTKTSDKGVRPFGDILAPLSRETEVRQLIQTLYLTCAESNSNYVKYLRLLEWKFKTRRSHSAILFGKKCDV